MTDALEKTQIGLVDVPWMQDAETRAYNGVLGAEKDRLIDRTRTGIKMRWPSGPKMQQVAQSVGAELDATAGDSQRLALIGAGFGLPRLGSMTDAQYESYLESAWDVQELAGTLASVENALIAYGIRDVEIVEEWQNMAGTWATPGIYGHRICIILGPDYGTLGWAPQSFPLPLPMPVFGIAGMMAGQLADVARLVRRWKDAGATPVKLVFRFKVGGITSPVFGVSGVPFPIPLSGGPDAVTFYVTGHYFNERINGAGLTEGLAFPLTFGPVYTLDNS